MKKMNGIGVIIVLFLFLNVLAINAQDELDERSFENGSAESADNANSETPNLIIQNMNISGSGCQPRTSDAVVSSDGKAVSILFDNFSVQSGDKAIKNRMTKNCRLAIAMSVLGSYQVAIVKSDYRGYNYLPESAQSKLISTYFITDRNYKKSRKFYKRQKVFNGPIDDDFFVTAKTNLNKKWSSCASKFLLDIDTQLIVKSPEKSREELYSGIDSLDVNSGHEIKYHFTWRRCLQKGKGEGRIKNNKSRGRR